MRNKRNDQTTTTYQPAPPVPVIKIPQGKPEPIGRQDRRTARVMSADNSDSHWANGLMVLAAFGIASAIYGYNTEDTKGAIIIFFCLTGLVVLIISGSLTTIIAMIFENITDRKALSVDAAEVEATRQIGVIQSQSVIELQQQQYEITMATIDKDQRLQLGYINATTDTPQTDNFVANIPAPANVAVRAFLSGCYGEDGFEYPGDVNGPGGMLTRNPWTNQWNGKPWADDARVLMETYVLKPAGNGKQWALKYATEKEASAALPRL